DDLVGAVRGPHLLGAEAVTEVVGQVLAQVDGVPVGIAVEGARYPGHRARDGRPQGRARRIGVLVGVQLDGDVELGGAVGVQVPEVLAEQAADHVGGGRRLGGHRASAPGTRPPPAARGGGRSSAPPSASTRGATAASESRSHSMTLTTLRYGY